MISKWRSRLWSCYGAGMEPTPSCKMRPCLYIQLHKHLAYRGEDQSQERITCSVAHSGGTAICAWCGQSQSLWSSSLLATHSRGHSVLYLEVALQGYPETTACHANKKISSLIMRGIWLKTTVIWQD